VSHGTSASQNQNAQTVDASGVVTDLGNIAGLTNNEAVTLVPSSPVNIFGIACGQKTRTKVSGRRILANARLKCSKFGRGVPRDAGLGLQL
jgi:hypothetical protein